MKKYLAVYTGSPEAMMAWQSLPEDERNRKMDEGIVAWKQWANEHAGSIIDLGGPLSRTKRVTRAGIADVRNLLGAYNVVQAESQEAAARLFLGHPHFTLFPGDGVDVMEILAIPGG